MAPFMRGARTVPAVGKGMGGCGPPTGVEDLASLSSLRITGIGAKDEFGSHWTLGEAPSDRESHHSWAIGCARSGGVDTIRLRDVAEFRQEFHSLTVFARVELVAVARSRICELA